MRRSWGSVVGRDVRVGVGGGDEREGEERREGTGRVVVGCSITYCCDSWINFEALSSPASMELRTLLKSEVNDCCIVVWWCVV